MLVLFNHWRKYIELWLNENWQTKDFFADFERLHNIYFSHICGIGLNDGRLEEGMQCFQASGYDINLARVPQHVTDACLDHLDRMTTKIKKTEANKEGKSNQQEKNKISDKECRESLKEDFRVLKKFRILHESAALGDYYAQAEKKLKEVKA